MLDPATREVTPGKLYTGKGSLPEARLASQWARNEQGDFSWPPCSFCLHNAYGGPLAGLDLRP